MMPLVVIPAGGFVVLLFLVAVMSLGVWWLVALIEVCTTPEEAWQRAGQSRIVYVLLMIFLGLIGTLIYAFGVRGRLRSARADLRGRAVI